MTRVRVKEEESVGRKDREWALGMSCLKYNENVNYLEYPDRWGGKGKVDLG